jgi:hypothetical protein
MNEQTELRTQVEEERELLERLIASQNTPDFARLFSRLAYNFDEGLGRVSVVQFEDSWAITWEHEGKTFTVDTGYGSFYGHLVEVWPLALLVEFDLEKLGHDATVARLASKGWTATCL